MRGNASGRTVLHMAKPFKPRPSDDEAGDATPRFHITAPGSWSPNAGRRPIWRGMLAEGDLAAVIAAPYAGKSLLAPYIAWRLAQGAAAFGRQTVATRAAWFAVEDSHGAADRVEAMRRTWGDAPDFRLITPGANGFSLLRDDDVNALVELVTKESIRIIVPDTLSAAAPGHQENSVEAVSLTMARTRRITRLGCAVLFTHHVAKSASNDENPSARGSGDLQAAFDFVLALRKAPDSDEVVARVVKNRNGPPGSFGFRIGTVDLGARDRWGEPLRAPVLAEELTAAEAQGAKPLPGGAAVVLHILDSLGGAAPIAALTDAATAIGVLSKSEIRDTRQTAFRRAMRELQDRGVVEIGEDGIARRIPTDAENWPEGDL